MKYVLVSGGVVSGLGKGVTASSIGVLLKNCGFRVTSIKIGKAKDSYYKELRITDSWDIWRRSLLEHGRRHHVAVRAWRSLRAG